MHQLTVFEMEEISGGALTDTLTDIVTWAAKEMGAVALGASLGAIIGTAYAGRWGGVCFGIAAGIVGWDMTLEYAEGMMNALYDGTLNFWSN